MILGIVSDSHDNLAAIGDAVDVLRDNGVELLLHAGDVVAPFSARRFLDLGVPVKAVYGNNDGELAGLAKVFPGIVEGPLAWQVEGRSVVMIHDATKLPRGNFQNPDLLIHGHTHETELVNQAGRVRLNPGELCGYLSGKRTLAVWDTDVELPKVITF